MFQYLYKGKLYNSSTNVLNACLRDNILPVTNKFMDLEDQEYIATLTYLLDSKIIQNVGQSILS